MCDGRIRSENKWRVARWRSTTLISFFFISWSSFIHTHILYSSVFLYSLFPFHFYVNKFFCFYFFSSSILHPFLFSFFLPFTNTFLSTFICRLPMHKNLYCNLRTNFFARGGYVWRHKVLRFTHVSCMWPSEHPSLPRLLRKYKLCTNYRHGSNACFVKERVGNKLTWKRTYEFNSKINKFSGIISPGGTFCINHRSPRSAVYGK